LHTARIAFCTLLLCASRLIADERRPLLITVDDLPLAAGRLHTDTAERERISHGLLAALQKHAVPSVGFVIWDNVRTPQDEALLDLWLKAGHELGSHSFSHLNYTTTDTDAYVADAEKARAGLGAFLARRERKLRFYRFPYLCEGETAGKLQAFRAYLEKSGQRNLPVTIDDQDWSFEAPLVKARLAGEERGQAAVKTDYLAMLRVAVRRAETLGDRLIGRKVPSVLLLHANEIGAAGWDEFFSWLEETGHRFASADEVLADPALAEPQDYAGRYGFGLWDRIDAQREQRRVRAAIADLVAHQVEAWNRGDLEAFCRVYAEDAVFASPSGLTRGRAAVLARYRAKYGDAAARGRLTIEMLETRLAVGTEESVFGDALPSGVHGASVLGRWRLEYQDKPTASGLTLLVLRPVGRRWEIVQDASL
jgi:peptidoglycan/xylan/chitin deacetylase (PgdA/CDA1 family)